MIESIAASPELLEQLMKNVAAQSAATAAGSVNPQAMQAALQGGAPDGFMAGNMPDPSAGVNNIPQELANMGYTPPEPAQNGQMDQALSSLANFQLADIQHHPLVQSTAQYVPMPQSSFNPYASTAGNMGLMELLAQAQQVG